MDELDSVDLAAMSKHAEESFKVAGELAKRVAVGHHDDDKVRERQLNVNIEMELIAESYTVLVPPRHLACYRG